MSETQQKRVEKIKRLRRYFKTDSPEIYEWNPVTDETIDFKSMSDPEISQYLERNK